MKEDSSESTLSDETMEKAKEATLGTMSATVVDVNKSGTVANLFGEEFES